MRTYILAVATAATVAALGLTTTAAAQPAHHPLRAQGTAVPVRGGRSTTVTGPHMYDPATGKLFGNASTVTVSQTTALVNQAVRVSWTNFTPSSAPLYNPQNIEYPVMVAECKGTHPASPADCYGAENGGVTATSGPGGPMNTAYATTAPGGNGQADIQILTAQQNYFLRCDQTHPCSLAVVPAQGGDVQASPPKCDDHALDRYDAVADLDFGATYYACSWAKRIVIPLQFARSAAECPLRKAAFTAAGSSMLARAMQSWEAALCVGSHPMDIGYNSAVSEPLAIEEAARGVADVALTTRPASADGIPTGNKHFVYAPVAVSAVSLAYWFDGPGTGQPQTGVKLDQRLVAKLLTQSYAYQNDGCPPPQPTDSCDNGVDGDPFDLFADPEFQQLNPRVLAPTDGDSFQAVPIVQAGPSDVTWTVTRWIAASKAASLFLAGQFDPWGHHVNTYYLGVKYPADAFVPQDPYPPIAHAYLPVFPFSLVATDMAENWPPATSPYPDPLGNYERYPAEIPGQRALIAVDDQADAAALLFPVAAVPNGAGRYTEPTSAAMAAAVTTMISDGSGTLQVNLHSTDKSVYPLTMVIYAMAPTSGLARAKAAAIARFIDYAAAAGQTPGVRAGQLPAGYLPLPAKLRAQARKAAQQVLHQSGGAKP